MPRKSKKSAVKIGRSLDLSGQLDRLIKNYDNRSINSQIEANLKSAGIREFDPAELKLFDLFSAENYDLDFLKSREESLQIQDQVFPIYVLNRDSHQLEVFSGVERYLLALAAHRKIKAALIGEIDPSLLSLFLLKKLESEVDNPLVIGYAYRTIRDKTSLSYSQLSRLLQVSKSQLINRVHLLNLPPLIKDAIKRRELSFAEARPLLGLPSKEAQLAVFEKIKAEALTAHQIAVLVSEIKHPEKQKLMRISQDKNRITITMPTAEAAAALVEKIKKL